MTPRHWLSGIGFALVSLGIAAGQETIPFEVPSQFTVQHFAGDDLVHDAWCLTIDSKDRVCVGGPGYIKFLLDTDGDGMADKAELFTDLVRTGVMGLLVDGTGRDQRGTKRRASLQR